MPPMPSRPSLRALLHALGPRRPKLAGVLRVAGPSAEIAIGRDRWGIPHIEASSDHDAWFGLGFCHSQDRGFQLELIARAGRGTLSEILGVAALPIDRLSRVLGFARAAADQAPLLDADIVAALHAYVDGVNAAAGVTPRPHELALLRSRRTTWRITDVIAFQALQSLTLPGSWDTELARLRILLADGADALRAVAPEYGGWLPVTAPVGAAAGAGVDRLATDIALLRDVVGVGGGSNAWAIGPAASSTGAALLANDPHLAPAVPGPWYLAHVIAPDWAVAGASFVGSPTFPTGHNGHAAWGITAACTDSADLFWEELDVAAGTVRGPSGEEPLEILEERLAVRGAPEVVERVLVTPRGPVMTPLLDGVTVALSVRATWLQSSAVRGFLGVHRARDFAAFREAFRDWPGPGLNVVYADAKGHIGWQVVGTLPRRRGGNGTLPMPAWDAEAGWERDPLPFDGLPHLLDPPESFVASANNAPRPDREDEPFLGADWLDGYRAMRIVSVLAERTDWDVASTMRLQADVRVAAWDDLRPFLLDGRSHSAADARVATDLLAEWEGTMSAESAAASVYELAVCELAASLARRDAPRSWRWAIGAGFGTAVARTTFGARVASHVVARLRAADTGERRALVAAALESAVRTLHERVGPDPAAWGWGAVRPLTLLHPLAARRPLDRIFNVGPVPLGGDANTVAQAGVSPLEPLRNPWAIPNQRTVIDLADPERSRFVLAGGQSGNPLSPHYADLFRLWQRGYGVPIAWSPAAMAAATVHRLVLQPRPYISPSKGSWGIRSGLSAR